MKEKNETRIVVKDYENRRRAPIDKDYMNCIGTEELRERRVAKQIMNETQFRFSENEWFN